MLKLFKNIKSNYSLFIKKNFSTKKNVLRKNKIKYKNNSIILLKKNKINRKKLLRRKRRKLFRKKKKFFYGIGQHFNKFLYR